MPVLMIRKMLLASTSQVPLASVPAEKLVIVPWAVMVPPALSSKVPLLVQVPSIVGLAEQDGASLKRQPVIDIYIGPVDRLHIQRARIGQAADQRHAVERAIVHDQGRRACGANRAPQDRAAEQVP